MTKLNEHIKFLWINSTVIIRILHMIQFNIRNSIPGIYCESNSITMLHI